MGTYSILYEAISTSYLYKIFDSDLLSSQIIKIKES